MTIENTQAHQVPFEIDSDNHVQDFVVPSEDIITTEIEELADTWQDAIDLTEYIDYSVNQIRNAQALAQAAEEKAKFAQRTAKGFKANVEYRRGLIEAALNAAVSRGLMTQPKVKSAEYSLGIQGTAGRVEPSVMIEEFRTELEEEVNYIAALLVTMVLEGKEIYLPLDSIDHLTDLSKSFKDMGGPVDSLRLGFLCGRATVTWDKKYLGQALKNNWLSEKLSKFFSVVKGKALVIRL